MFLHDNNTTATLMWSCQKSKQNKHSEDHEKGIYKRKRTILDYIVFCFLFVFFFEPFFCTSCFTLSPLFNFPIKGKKGNAFPSTSMNDACPNSLYSPGEFVFSISFVFFSILYTTKELHALKIYRVLIKAIISRIIL